MRVRAPACMLGAMAHGPLTLLVAAGLLLGLAAADANAAIRYATPGGDNSNTSCPQSDPCDIEIAAEHSSVADGDIVLVAAGTYEIGGLGVADEITIAGPTTGPAPTIRSGGSGILSSAEDSVAFSDLRIEAEGVALRAAAATIERVETTSRKFQGCLLSGDVVVRDSICASADREHPGIEFRPTSGAGAETLSLVNVTAAGGIGLRVFRDSGAAADAVVSARNTIAAGFGQLAHDLAVRNSGGGRMGSVAVSLESSNFEGTWTSGERITVTQPGAAGNQTTAPVFVDVAGQDFHQAPTSPTINAGTNLGSEAGRLDIDRESRIREGTVDIGADEGDAAPVVSIVAGPANGSVIGDPTPSFHFEANETGVAFTCIYGPADASFYFPTTCSSPFTASPRPDGEYLFGVTGTDSAGGEGSDHRTFTIDTTPPVTPEPEDGAPNPLPAPLRPTPPPSADRSDRSAPALRILGRGLRMDRRGRIVLRLHCPVSEASPPCAGTVRVVTARQIRQSGRSRRVALAGKRFSVAAGRTAKLRLEVRKSSVRLLRTSPATRRLLIVASFRDRAGNDGKASRRLSLRFGRGR